MDDSKSLDVIKSAILLEKRGKTLYELFAKQTQNDDVKEFFLMMAREEEKHIQMLSEQFKHIQKNQVFMTQDLMPNKDTSAKILTQKIVAAIETAGFEAAAISASINMEQKAVEMYTKQADAAKDPEEKRLYEWLSKWESSHVNYLVEIDNELKEKIWFDNHFWPM